MSLLDATKMNYSLKKLMGKTHSVNKKDPANEANATYIALHSTQVWVDTIPTDATAAVAAGVAEFIICDVELDVTSNSKSYRCKYPTGHALAGQYVSEAIPTRFGNAYEPVLWRNRSTGDRIYIADSSDWLFDPESATITSEDDLTLTSNSKCDVYRYVGKKLSTAGAVGKSYAVEEFTYSGQTTLTLSNAPVSNSNVRLVVYGGIEQDNGVDFLVSGTTVTLTGYPIASILENGDIIQVSYTYAG
jgi:hypothetical protein